MKENIAYYERMVDVGEQLPEDEMNELLAWERENIPKGEKTSDWPGWKKYIGLPPWKL
jgi:hypothetical protein